MYSPFVDYDIINYHHSLLAYIKSHVNVHVNVHVLTIGQSTPTRGAEVLVDRQPGQQPFLARVASGHQLCLGLRGSGDAPTSGAPGDPRLGAEPRNAAVV